MNRAASIIRDIELAEVGNLKLDWVAEHSPVLNLIAERYLKDGTFAGLTIGMTIPIGPKVSHLATVLQDAGAQVVVTSPSSSFVQDDAAAALVSRGITVYGSSALPEEEVHAHFERVLAHKPDVLMDDRAEFVHLLLTEHRHLLDKVRGSSEQTTTGVTRLEAMEAEGLLEFPAFAANAAKCKHLFDNRYGTGQSAVSALLDVTNLYLGGKVVVVAGYGWVGRGVALRAKGNMARVIVTERDPVRALEAYADGFQVLRMDQAAEVGDVFISCTGVHAVINDSHFPRMKDNALLVNAGAVDTEVEVHQLADLAVERFSPRAGVETFVMPDGRQLHLLGGGRVLNVAAGEGHPVEIMDMTYSAQAMSMYYLTRHYRTLEPGLHYLPAELDEEIARAAVDAHNLGLEAPAGETPA